MNFLPGDEVTGDPFQPFLFEVCRWLPHMPRHCINTLRGIGKCRANSTTTAIIAVRKVIPLTGLYRRGGQKSLADIKLALFCITPTISWKTKNTEGKGGSI
ncbi:hypothetical protein AVEN_7113-1 [Araneus ventricosus]|uniref:Uncharacterized protein n=1 Tax=Araneus ventricosus TaxID=182803 RepID=A0A4Y2LVQ5_ARAVE|nr:hypothetical protein AVEN_7113-1 [Araneus ventricosus]